MVSVMANKEADFDMEVAVVSSHSIAFSGCSIASWVYFLRVSLEPIPVTIPILIYNLNSQHLWNKKRSSLLFVTLTLIVELLISLSHSQTCADQPLIGTLILGFIFRVRFIFPVQGSGIIVSHVTLYLLSLPYLFNLKRGFNRLELLHYCL